MKKISIKTQYNIFIILASCTMFFGFFNLLYTVDYIPPFFDIFLGILYLVLWLIMLLMLIQISKRNKMFTSEYRGTCKTCNRTAILNSKNECFLCWDKSN